MTPVNVVLFRHSFGRLRFLLAGMGVVLAVFQVLATAMATTFEESHTFERLAALVPPFMRDLMGPTLLATLSFRGIVCIGYFHVAIIAALVGLAVAIGTEPVGEIEQGVADLLYARPVPRRAAVTRTVAVLVASTAAMLAAMLGGTWLGLWLVAPAGAPWPPPALLAALSVNLGALVICWGAIAVAAAAASRRRAVAGAVTGTAALALFLLDYVGKVWKPAALLSRASPFRYYNAFDLITGRPLPWSHVWVLAGIAAAALALGYRLYGRRDL